MRSNFLIDDNFSDKNVVVDDIMVIPLAEPASADLPTTVVPSGSIVVPVDTHPTTDSCVPANNAPSMILPNGAAVAGAGGGGDDDFLPTSDVAKDGDSDNESYKSDHTNVSGNDDGDNESQQSYQTKDGHHSDLFENCFEIVPANLTCYRSVGTHQDGVLPSHEQDFDFNMRAKLLYANWNVMHSFTSLPGHL